MVILLHILPELMQFNQIYTVIWHYGFQKQKPHESADSSEVRLEFRTVLKCRKLTSRVIVTVFVHHVEDTVQTSVAVLYY